MLIDINVSFGGRETIQRFTREGMFEQLQRLPLSLAFVHCHQGMTDCVLANDQTLALCREHPHLRPTGVLHPRAVLDWRREVERCLDAGTRMFRVYPDQGGWPVDSVFFDQLVERLDGTGVALMLESTTPGLPSFVAERTAGARVPVIFTEARYYPLTEIIPLMERYPHLYVETGRITSPENIELCVSRVGADRLLFGSGAARYPSWVAWQVLERADISDADRESLAWRNASRLLHVQPEPPRVQGVPEPARWRDKGIRIIDVHMHDQFPGATVRSYSAAAYMEDMRRWGIDQGICSSVTSIFYDLKQGNDEVDDLLRQAPCVHGYVVVDPRYYEESVEELHRLERNPRFVGVKIHAAHAKTPTNSRAMRRLFDAVAPYGKPVLIHNLGDDWPEALVDIAGTHPSLPIIAAHSGYGDGPHPTHDAALRVAPAPNIFIEFCSTYLAVGAIRRGIEAVGIHRVMYGSDFPLIAQPYMMAAYEDAGLEGPEIDRVLHRNARELFNLPGKGDDLYATDGTTSNA